MNRREDEKYDKTIKDLIINLGTEATDDYLQEELKITIKNVAALREKIKELKEHFSETTNSDEKMHLKYDIQDHENLLKNLLMKLERLDESYRYLLSYIAQPSKIE